MGSAHPHTSSWLAGGGLEVARLGTFLSLGSQPTESSERQPVIDTVRDGPPVDDGKVLPHLHKAQNSNAEELPLFKLVTQGLHRNDGEPR